MLVDTSSGSWDHLGGLVVHASMVFYIIVLITEHVSQIMFHSVFLECLIEECLGTLEYPVVN